MLDYLDGDLRKIIVQQLGDAALSIGDSEYEQESILRRLVTELSDKQINATLNKASQYVRSESKLPIYMKLLQYNHPELLEVIRANVLFTLHKCSISDRKRVLQFCAQQEFFQAPVVTQETIIKIIQHIREICGEWSWV